MSRFTPNPAAPKLIGQLQIVEALLAGQAHLIAKNTRQIAPKDDDAPHYVDMITVDQGRDGGLSTARVNANKFTANFLEFGTEDTPVFAPLRRGAQMAGFRLEA